MRFHVPAEARPLISLTPLIDVVFILLVFFMLASSFLDWRAVEMTTPSGAAAPAAKSESLVVDVLGQGRLRFAGRVVALDKARSVLRLEGARDRPVVVRPAAGVSLQEALRVADLATALGARAVSFAPPANARAGGKP